MRIIFVKSKLANKKRIEELEKTIDLLDEKMKKSTGIVFPGYLAGNPLKGLHIYTPDPYGRFPSMHCYR